MTYRVRVVGSGRQIPETRVSGRLVETRYTPPEMVTFDHAVVERVDFGGATFPIFNALGARFVDCDFRQGRFETGSFSLKPQTVYVDCRFDGSDLRRIDLGQARFERCVFDGALIHDWGSDAAEFIDCHFLGRITQSRFCGRPWGMWQERGYLDPHRSRNEFRGNDFQDVELIDCSFKFGIDIGAQQWPEGGAYVRLDRLPERINRARAAVSRWPDPRERDLGLAMLDIYSKHGFEEQPELFARRDDVAEIPVSGRVWEILESVLPSQP